MADTNLPAEGHAGIAPPADAPQEVSRPLTADAGSILDAEGQLHRPIDRARANERELQPLTYRDSVQQAAAELAGTAAPGVVKAPEPVKAAVVAAAPPPIAAVAVAKAPNPVQPAASNSDTPSRGLPGTAYSPYRDPTRAPLTVEGGFGSGGGEYFALDGTELREAIAFLLGDLFDQAENDARIVGLSGDTIGTVSITLTIPDRPASGEIGFTMTAERGNPDGDLVRAIDALFQAFIADVKQDLRFGIAASYPEYSLTLTLRVKAHAGDPGFTLVKHRREFDDAGNPETPPDALREELGLPLPSWQTTMAGSLGAMSSDVRA